MLKFLRLFPKKTQLSFATLPTAKPFPLIFRVLRDPSTPLAEKTSALKTLLLDPLAKTKHEHLLQESLKAFAVELVLSGQGQQKDPEIFPLIDEFRTQCLKNGSGPCLETAIFLSRLCADAQSQRLAENATLRKIKERVTQTDPSALAKEISSLDHFVSFAIEVKRSDIADLVLEKINEIYSSNYKDLSLTGQLTLASIFGGQKQGSVDHRIPVIIQNILENLEEAQTDEFVEIADKLGEIIYDRFPFEIEKIESLAICLAKKSFESTEIYRIFAAVSNFSSLKFWEEFFPLLENLVDLLDVHSLSDLIFSCAILKRGLPDFHEAILKKTASKASELSCFDKLKLFFASKHFDFESDFFDFNSLRKEIFTKGFIRHLKIDELLFFAKQVGIFRSLPDESRAVVFEEIEMLKISQNPEIRMLYQTHFAVGNQ